MSCGAGARGARTSSWPRRAASARRKAPPVVKLQPGDWPGFRGPERDGRLTGVRIAADWNQTPPEGLWRHRVGPGWGSFAVVGDNVYTQEQRDKDESVVCYDADTGKEIWAHDDATRFDEAMAGAGPRATPTFHDGKIYALGANGRLNCLDAATGAVVWTRDVAADSGAKLPHLGLRRVAARRRRRRDGLRRRPRRQERARLRRRLGQAADLVRRRRPDSDYSSTAARAARRRRAGVVRDRQGADGLRPRQGRRPLEVRPAASQAAASCSRPLWAIRTC